MHGISPLGQTPLTTLARRGAASPAGLRDRTQHCVEGSAHTTACNRPPQLSASSQTTQEKLGGSRPATYLRRSRVRAGLSGCAEARRKLLGAGERRPGAPVQSESASRGTAALTATLVRRLVAMEGAEAVDGDAAARGWSPQQLNRLTSFLLGGDDAAADRAYSEALRGDAGACIAPVRRVMALRRGAHGLLAAGAVANKLATAPAEAGGLLFQDRDARASELDALGGETLAGSGAAHAAEESGRKRSSRCVSLQAGRLCASFC